MKELRLANRLSPFLPGGDSSLCTVVPPCTFIHRDADIFIGINIIASPRLKKKNNKKHAKCKGQNCHSGSAWAQQIPLQLYSPSQENGNRSRVGGPSQSCCPGVQSDASGTSSLARATSAQQLPLALSTCSRN